MEAFETHEDAPMDLNSLRAMFDSLSAKSPKLKTFMLSYLIHHHEEVIRLAYLGGCFQRIIPQLKGLLDDESNG